MWEDGLKRKTCCLEKCWRPKIVRHNKNAVSSVEWNWVMSRKWSGPHASHLMTVFPKLLIVHSWKPRKLMYDPLLARICVEHLLADGIWRKSIVPGLQQYRNERRYRLQRTRKGSAGMKDMDGLWTVRFQAGWSGHGCGGNNQVALCTPWVEAETGCHCQSIRQGQPKRSDMIHFQRL